MDDLNQIISCLQHTPLILSSIIREIPPNLLKKRRIKNKWCIHEHVCHLAQAEDMILKRFQTFKTVDFPQFKPYLPGKTVTVSQLLDLDLREQMERFEQLRNSLISTVRSFDPAIWRKKANHHEYTEYNAYILLRHTLMHDHFHMYRIEELWLTKEEYLG